MKKTYFTALVACLAIVALGMMGTDAQKTAVHGITECIRAAQNAARGYVNNIVTCQILPTLTSKNTSFLELQGSLQTQRVAAAYYNAAWKAYDSQQKLNLRALKHGTSLETLTNSSTGLPGDQVKALVQQQHLLLPGLSSTLPILLNNLSIESLAHLFVYIPYHLFTTLAIPLTTLTPTLLALNWNARYTKKSLYNNKHYKSLKPLFDLCDKRISKDWKAWNTNMQLQQTWFNYTAEKKSMLNTRSSV